MRTVNIFGRYTLFQFTNNFSYEIASFDSYLDFVAVVNNSKSGFLTYQSGVPSPFSTFSPNSGYLIVSKPSTPFSITMEDLSKPDFLQFGRKYNIFQYPYNVPINLNDYADYIESVLITNNSRSGFITIYQPGFSGPTTLLQPGSAYLLVAFGDFVIPNPEVSPTPTGTPENTPTCTPTVTLTPTPNATSTPTSTPGSTPTKTPNPTATETPTNTPTTTPPPGASPGPTPTSTPTPTGTPAPTPTITRTNTPTQTRTPSNTPTNAPTNTPTNTPSNTSTQTNTPTFTRTPTQTRTPSQTPTNSPTPSFTPSQTSTQGNEIFPIIFPDNRVLQINDPDPFPDNLVVQIGPAPTRTPTQTRTPAVTPSTTTTLTQSQTPTRPVPVAPLFIDIQGGNGTVNLKSLYDAAGGDSLANNDICFIVRGNRGTTDPNGYAIDTGTWSTSIAANRQVCLVLPGDYRITDENSRGIAVVGAQGAAGSGRGGDSIILRRNIFISSSIPGQNNYWNPGLGYSGRFRGGGGGGCSGCNYWYAGCGGCNGGTANCNTGGSGYGWNGSGISGAGATSGCSSGGCSCVPVPPYGSCCPVVYGCCNAGPGGWYGQNGGDCSNCNKNNTGAGGAMAPNGQFGINKNGFNFTYV